MNIEDRILESTTKFNEQKEQREQHLAAADECLTEMNRLQGEYRVLTDLRSQESSSQEADPALTVTAKPEKVAK